MQELEQTIPNQTSSEHISVLLEEVAHAFMPISGKVIVDGTFGAGGYTKRLIELGAAHVIGIDRDPLAADFVERHDFDHNHFSFIAGRFSAVKELLKTTPYEQVDGFVLDIGVSSMQLDYAERGFSFMKDGPLDMRMGRDGVSAADIVNEYSESDIANILFYLGEEKKSRQIAKAICLKRQNAPITKTAELAKLIEETIPKSYKEKKHPATRSFQALRIAVNEELDELREALESAQDILKPDGVLAVVTFHSLEDRIVKQFLNLQSGKSEGVSRHMPQIEQARPKIFNLPKGYPINASDEECRLNPRARSARLRVGIRTHNNIESRV